MQPEDMNALTISVNNTFRWDEMNFRVEKPKPPEPEPEPEPAKEVTWTVGSWTPEPEPETAEGVTWT